MKNYSSSKFFNTPFLSLFFDDILNLARLYAFRYFINFYSSRRDDKFQTMAMVISMTPIDLPALFFFQQKAGNVISIIIATSRRFPFQR